MCFSLIMAYFVLQLQWGECWGSGPVVHTVNGLIQGLYVGKSRAFLGIPFARPPTGIRRFALPESPDNWKEVLNATSYPPRCLQMSEKVDFFDIPPRGDSEDCLYLNIFAPEDMKRDLAVMVFIHGGSFYVGSSYEYGTDGIVANLVSRDVIVVVIQYRLGIFGFLSTGDLLASGNWGLWDQLEALKWIRLNIAEFGGDTERVTIFGESAGAMSASLLSYSPAAQDYFHSVIQQSGSAYSLNAVTDEAVELTGILAQHMGCSKKSAADIISCLRTKDSLKILETHRNLFELAYAQKPVLSSKRWTPRVDGFIIPDDLNVLAGTLMPKPTIIGTNNLEMAFFATPLPGLKLLKRQALKAPDDLSLQFFDDVIDKTLKMMGLTQNPQLFRQLAHYHYFDTEGNSNNVTFRIQQYTQLLSDTYFYAPSSKEAGEKVHIGTPMWLYSFDYYNEAQFPKNFPWKGAHHSFELLYLLGIDLKVLKFSRNEEDNQVTNLLADIWTHFAKEGEPPKNIHWPQMHSVESSPTLHIRGSNLLTVEPNFHLKTSMFWNRLLPDLQRNFQKEEAIKQRAAKKNREEL